MASGIFEEAGVLWKRSFTVEEESPEMEMRNIR
jgi:hypothetical protein